ncbi:hypothetical protein MIND_00391500 [Mycena indigotica]|uniref:Uncharacterized protein n=1 Tax=Mycena indigotica TaxID=2126181 RepID=A0A8H6WF56_9AGAR|nr:uncharacterized protein MIND_00391500 [Mycena indigotica]KAF7310179.1 hypothetical protein MIND_00391500 [Mycena indigotica]
MPARPPYNGDQRKLVLGIDIGTTFSGISYCVLEPGREPDIVPVTRFPLQPTLGGDSKVPTIVYYDKRGQAKAFGAEAMDESIRETAIKQAWEMVSWFKLHMRPNSVAITSPGRDFPPLPTNKLAVDIFSDFLRYVFRCARTFIIEHIPGGELMWTTFEDSIEFVVTHPNGWEGEQQADLRQAAVNARLVPDSSRGHRRLHFVTEGEASLNFCIVNGLATNPLNAGKGVIIVDAGGGTIDISAYRKTSSPGKRSTFEEIAQTACLMDGSVFVTKNAREYLNVVLRNSKYHEAVDEIAECFDQTTKLKFREPSEMSYIRFGTLRDKDAAFNIFNGQMKLPGTVVAAFFQPSIDAIVQAIAIQQSSAKVPISDVLLVGGFAASDWLHSELKRRLAPMNLVVSRPDAHVNKAVSDGAVSFFIDRFVKSRIAKDFYGIMMYTSYDEYDVEHCRRSETRFVNDAGRLSIGGQFRVILARGTSVRETQEFRGAFSRLATEVSHLTSIEVDLLRYQGKNSKPRWRDVEPEKYQTMCGIHAHTHQAAQSLRPQFGPRGMYYRFSFEVVFSFGTTELKAQIAWKEDGVEKR